MRVFRHIQYQFFLIASVCWCAWAQCNQLIRKLCILSEYHFLQLIPMLKVAKIVDILRFVFFLLLIRIYVPPKNWFNVLLWCEIFLYADIGMCLISTKNIHFFHSLALSLYFRCVPIFITRAFDWLNGADTISLFVYNGCSLFSALFAQVEITVRFASENSQFLFFLRFFFEVLVLLLYGIARERYVNTYMENITIGCGIR